MLLDPWVESTFFPQDIWREHVDTAVKKPAPFGHVIPLVIFFKNVVGFFKLYLDEVKNPPKIYLIFIALIQEFQRDVVLGKFEILTPHFLSSRLLLFSAANRKKPQVYF